MKQWRHSKEEPYNFELTIIKQLDLIDKKLKREKWLADTKPEIYDLEMHIENMDKLKRLCMDHGIDPQVLSARNRKNLSQKQLINELTHGLNQPFMYYKKNGKLERTYIKFNLKQK